MKKHFNFRVGQLTWILAVSMVSFLFLGSCTKSNPPSLPVLTTANVTAITSTSAVSGGIITNDGGSAVDSRGVCWKTSSGPTIGDSKTIDGSGTGEFTSNLTQLLPNTTYYLKAYATNQAGTAYGNELSFTTSQGSQVSNEVKIQNFAFAPVTLTVPVNTTVTWTNKDATAHTVTSDTGLFNSGDLSTNATFSFTFTAAGTYAYHCAIHTYMTASIVVQ